VTLRLRVAAIAALSLPLLFSSCRKDLCYNHFRSASVTFTWEYAWERDYGTHLRDTWDAAQYGVAYDALFPGMPEGVTLLIYDDSRSMPRTNYISVAGADINLGTEAVHRSLLFYNNDTECVIISDVAELPSARATTTTRSRFTLLKIRELHPDERTINAPDVLFASFISDLPDIGIHQTVALPVTMQPLVYTYMVRYEFEYGREHVALARGALAGMAEAVYLRDGVTSDESATILYDCDLTSCGATALVRTFGVPAFPDDYYGRTVQPRKERIYTLNLEVRLTNGTLKEFNFDVSDQLAVQPRGGVISVSGIRVEDGENLSASGFNVSVNDWGEQEDIVLPVGSPQQINN